MNETNIQHKTVKLQVVDARYVKNTSNNTGNNTLNDIVYNHSSSKDEQIMQALDAAHVHTNKAPLKSFLKDLVNEHADKDQEQGYYLWSHTLFNHDKKIILSYLVDPQELSYYCSSPERFECVLKEYENTIQNLLDDMCAEVYQDDKESVYEAGYDRYKEDQEDQWLSI